MDLAQLLRWLGWALLAALAFALMFTKIIIDWLGWENSLQSAVLVIVPLVIAAAAIEWVSRHLAK